MSRDTNSICRTCGVYEPGDGLNWTLMDCYANVKDFDAALLQRFNMLPENLPDDHVNAQIRRFLVRHEGHEVSYWSNDWYYADDDPLKGLVIDGEWR